MSQALIPCAGTHVRSAATVGGNLALSLQRRLESDLVTVLMGSGAKVEVSSSGGSRCVVNRMASKR